MREGKKISNSDKVKMEEAMGLKFPGTPGLRGKEHLATGPRFLQALVKAKKDNNYDLPAWEERCLVLSASPKTLSPIPVMLGPQRKKSWIRRRRQGKTDTRKVLKVRIFTQCVYSGGVRIHA
jgi:hypothetical protein